MESLKWVHDQGIAHRDLKLENILIKYDYDIGDNAPFQTKLIDFGLSIVI